MEPNVFEQIMFSFTLCMWVIWLLIDWEGGWCQWNDYKFMSMGELSLWWLCMNDTVVYGWILSGNANVIIWADR